MRRRGPGSIKQTAISGYTSIAITRATRQLLEEVRNHRGYDRPSDSFDDLVWRLAFAKLAQLLETHGREPIDSPIAQPIGRRATLADSGTPV